MVLFSIGVSHMLPYAVAAGMMLLVMLLLTKVQREPLPVQ
jgi:hypothetical protein